MDQVVTHPFDAGLNRAKQGSTAMTFDPSVVEIICYRQIFQRGKNFQHPAYAAVSLNRYQSWLFRSRLDLLTNAGTATGKLHTAYDLLKLVLISLTTLATAPQLGSLSDFYEWDSDVRNRVKFVPTGSQIIVYFLPRSDGAR